MPTVKEDSKDMGISDECKEQYKEWPPVIVRKADLSTIGVEGDLGFSYPAVAVGF